MKPMPQIQKFMTTLPTTVAESTPLTTAIDLMRTNRIRHLPVLSPEGGLVGILSDRDVKLASSFQGAAEMTAGDVMTPEPYSVFPDAPIDRVVLEMAERKYGCAVVIQANGKVVGIFTANDGLRVLGEQLPEFYRETTPTI